MERYMSLNDIRKYEVYRTFLIQEAENECGINIFFTGDGTPIVCGASARRLCGYIPDFSAETFSLPGEPTHEIMTGFPLEPVIEKFKEVLFVDNDAAFTFLWETPDFGN